MVARRARTGGGASQLEAGLALTLGPALAYLLAMLLAGIAPGVSLVIYGVLPLLYFLSITILRSDRKRDQEYTDFN